MPSHIIQSVNTNLFEKVLGDSTCLPLCLERIPVDFYNILVTCMACNSRRSARFISERSLTTSHMQHAIAAWVSWSRWLRWKNLFWQRKDFYPALLVHARDESPRFLPWICSSHFTWPFWFGLSISRHCHFMSFYLTWVCLNMFTSNTQLEFIFKLHRLTSRPLISLEIWLNRTHLTTSPQAISFGNAFSNTNTFHDLGRNALKSQLNTRQKKCINLCFLENTGWMLSSNIKLPFEEANLPRQVHSRHI